MPDVNSAAFLNSAELCGNLQINGSKIEYQVTRPYQVIPTGKLLDALVVIANRGEDFLRMSERSRHDILAPVGAMAFAAEVDFGVYAPKLPQVPARLLSHVQALKKAVEEALIGVTHPALASLYKRQIFTEYLKGINFVPTSENLESHASNILRQAVIEVARRTPKSEIYSDVNGIVNRGVSALSGHFSSRAVPA